MQADSKRIIGIIALNDLIICIPVSIVLYFTLGLRFCFFALGIFFSLINFVINAFTTERLTLKNCQFKVLLTLLSYAVRIGLICGTGVFLFYRSKISFFLFVAGYSAQILAILIYGFKLKKLEGM